MNDTTGCDCVHQEGEGRACEACRAVTRAAVLALLGSPSFWLVLLLAVVVMRLDGR